MTHGSLFSGIGGFELGSELAGIKTVWSCEIDPSRRKVLKRHFPETVLYDDISKLADPPKVDIVSGGFPCQDISWNNAWGKGLKGERSAHWKEMFRIISEVRPRYVLIENSPNLLRRGMQELLGDISQMGYDAEWGCLRASDFGYPHKKERIFIIAYTNSQRRSLRRIIKGELIQEVLSKSPSNKINFPMPFKRFDGDSDYGAVKLHDGFSREMDFKAVKMFGNAVIPTITHFLFECVKEYENTHH